MIDAETVLKTAQNVEKIVSILDLYEKQFENYIKKRIDNASLGRVS